MFGLKWRMIGIMAALSVALAGIAYAAGRWDGSAACDARHVAETAKVVKRVRKTDVKIKNAAPSDSNKPAGIKFLLEHVRN